MNAIIHARWGRGTRKWPVASVFAVIGGTFVVVIGQIFASMTNLSEAIGILVVAGVVGLGGGTFAVLKVSRKK
jgi:hypothetical protein